VCVCGCVCVWEGGRRRVLDGMGSRGKGRLCACAGGVLAAVECGDIRPLLRRSPCARRHAPRVRSCERRLARAPEVLRPYDKGYSTGTCRVGSKEREARWASVCATVRRRVRGGRGQQHAATTLLHAACNTLRRSRCTQRAPTTCSAHHARYTTGAEETLTWDKDDEDALDFVVAASNLRAHGPTRCHRSSLTLPPSKPTLRVTLALRCKVSHRREAPVVIGGAP
jgi:hypothetical protein